MRSEMIKALPTSLHRPQLSAVQGGGEERAAFISSPCCFGIDSVSYSYASCILHCPSTRKIRLG